MQAQEQQAVPKFETQGFVGKTARQFARELRRAGYICLPFGSVYHAPESLEVSVPRYLCSWLVQQDSAGRWQWYRLDGRRGSGSVAAEPHSVQCAVSCLHEALTICRRGGARDALLLQARAYAMGGAWAGSFVGEVRGRGLTAFEFPGALLALRSLGVQVTGRELGAVAVRGRRMAARFWEVG